MGPRRLPGPLGAAAAGVWRVSEKTWRVVLPLPITTNCWLVEEADGLTLVDAGYPWSWRALLRAAEGLGRPIRRVLVTHAHPDHAGALARLGRVTGAEILAHPLEIPFLLGRRSLAQEPGSVLCRSVLWMGHRLGILDPPPVEKVTPVDDGDRVGSLEVLHTPGHTPGSISLWQPEDGALFCGDNAAFTFWFLHLGVPWYTLDVPERDRGVARCAELPATRLLSGHGPVYEGAVGRKLRELVG